MVQGKPTFRERRRQSWFGSLISNATPVSSMRWTMVVTVIISNTVVWIPWLVISLTRMQLQDLPAGIVEAYLGVNALAITGKFLQSKFAETTLQECAPRREEIPVPEEAGDVSTR